MDAVGQQARADVECVEKFCEAQKILDEMIQRSKREEVSPFYVAAVYVALGDKEHGLEWLEKAYAEGRNC